MTTRRRLTAISLALIGLVATGCGGDDGATDTTTTTRAKSTSTAVVGSIPESSIPATTAPPTTAHDSAAFAAAVSEMNSKLDAAGNDFCKIALSANAGANAGVPSTPEETKSLYEYYKRTFDKIADVLPASSGEGAGDADLLRAAANKMMADAQANNYDPAAFSKNGPPPAFNEANVLAAMQRLNARITKDCGPAASGK